MYSYISIGDLMNNFIDVWRQCIKQAREDYPTVCADMYSMRTLLTVLFVGLKLTGNIIWSWWWVLSPLCIPFVTNCLLMFIGYLFWKKIIKD